MLAKQSVFGSATIVSGSDDMQPFQMGTFVRNTPIETSVDNQKLASLNSQYIEPKNSNYDDSIVNEMKNLASLISSIEKKVSLIESEGVKGKDLDKQVITAIKDLKQYASFYEKAALGFEAKVLKTSISIAKKIISIEVSQNSAAIAKETISNILGKIKTASRVNIHLHPKDYLVLKQELHLESFINLYEDPNVMPGGVVIASDLGNFDGNIDAKVSTMLESLDAIS